MQRADWLGFTAATVAATTPSLFFGAVLTARTKNASLLVYDHNSTGNATRTKIKLRLYQYNPTGTTAVVPPLPLQMDNGIFISMSSGAHGTVFFSKRT